MTVSPVELTREQRRWVYRQELARRGLADFCELMLPGYSRAIHTDYVCTKLEALERGDIRNLIIEMPPRHSKTLHATEMLPAWWIGRHPSHQIITTGYSEDLAHLSSGKVRRMVGNEMWPFPDVSLSPESRAVDMWQTSHGGVFRAAGLEGSLTGYGAHLLVVDDAFKNREEARSETTRNSRWNNFQEAARTRMMPGGRKIVSGTRWHEDDVIGRLLRQEPDMWELIHLPSIAEDDDQLGRRVGEALWPAWFPIEMLEEIKESMRLGADGLLGWNAIYQQNPVSAEGNMFKRVSFGARYDDEPDCRLKIMGIDGAWKQGAHNDRSAIVVAGLAEKPPARYPILDAWARRVEYPELKRKVRDMVARHRPHTVAIEDTASGIALGQELKAEGGMHIVMVKVAGMSKEARAAQVQGIVESGEILLPRSSAWVDDFVNEMCAFPNGRHDDYVDAVVHALRRMLMVTGYGAARPRSKPREYKVMIGGGRKNEEEEVWWPQ
ncbi:MAG: phage terminase large subunit [bacterium]